MFREEEEDGRGEIGRSVETGVQGFLFGVPKRIELEDTKR